MKNKRIFIYKVGRHKFDFINHNLKPEFVDSGVYFVQDEANFIYPLLQVWSRSGSGEKVPDPEDQKSKGPNGYSSLQLRYGIYWSK